jgi:hypothetical protein
MSDEVRVINANMDRAEIALPAFGSTPSLILDVSKIREGEARLVEAQMVNPATYANLEYVFNEGYREAKRHMSVIGYQITQAEKALREAKSTALLDEYPEFLKKSAIKDSAQIRDAFLERYVPYTSAQDRIDMLKAMESLIDGKIKTFENTCRYMKVEMQLTIRSGVDSNKYSR